MTDRPLLALALLLLTACEPTSSGTGSGGASPGGAAGPPTPGATRFAGGALPGRLLVSRGRLRVRDLNWVSYLQDLSTGTQTELPLSTEVRHKAEDDWFASHDGRTLLRLAEPQKELALFDATTLGGGMKLSVSDLRYPVLSPNGRYVLASWHDTTAGEYSTDAELTVFDMSTGKVARRGSKQRYGYTMGRSHAWLPDGRYVYLVGSTLYVSSPESELSSIFLDIQGLPAADTEYYTFADIALSPDGTRLALSWREKRGSSIDSNLWVVGLDGSGLHRLTTVPDPTSALNMPTRNPAWSPDSKWVGGVRYLSGVVVDDEDKEGVKVIGTTGCVDDVAVIAADATEVPIPWPSHDSTVNLTTYDEAGKEVWLSLCGGTVAWVP